MSPRPGHDVGGLGELRVPDFSVALDGHGAVPAQGPGSALDGSTCVAFTPSKAMSHVRLRHGSGDFDTMGT